MSIEKTPWDEAAFGFPTYQVSELDEAALNFIAENRGHYTLKIDPLADKKPLYAQGFYYCDTLIEPRCLEADFRAHESDEVAVSFATPLEELLPICHGAFSHGRFHRDFNLDPALADLRYDRWLEALYRESGTMGLYFRRQLAGFIAFSGGKLLLHALAPSFRGKGLAKYLWSAACRELFGQGAKELASSISAANLPVVNLYSSLGFRFENAADVYHLLK